MPTSEKLIAAWSALAPRYVALFDPVESRGDAARFLLLRGLGLIYAVAFLSLARQVIPLLGDDGLLPADLFIERIHDRVTFLQLPSLFRIVCSDAWLLAGAWIGFAMALTVMLGVSNAVLMTALWILYMSYVHIGQIFYGYGWETMTLEAGFLAIFLCPLRSMRMRTPTPPIMLFWYRWMLFRTMFGAGLIKIRGGDCWRDLTCLVYHYETQPIPNAVSWYLHQMPLWFHQAGVLFNHFVELIVPFFYFAPRKLRHIAGGLTIAFQAMLILSGNLSWLNWLTIVIAIPCFDDKLLRWIPKRGLSYARSRPRTVALVVVSIILLFLSHNPIFNMLSSRQKMNASFDPFHIMNTYGAFGSVGEARREICIEGSVDGIDWRAYEFLAKPGDPARRPPTIAPYQSRVDWQIWFAAMQNPNRNPWLIHMVYKLLNGHQKTAGLLRTNPFPDTPPRWIRCAYYEYTFTTDRSQGTWWERTYLGLWLPPFAADDPRLVDYVTANGWLR